MLTTLLSAATCLDLPDFVLESSEHSLDILFIRCRLHIREDISRLEVRVQLYAVLDQLTEWILLFVLEHQ